VTATALRFVALGDSYTIGTSVSAAERWPDQLVAKLGPAKLGPASPTLRLVGNLAVNGYTTRDVIDRELPDLAPLRPDFVSLLIGVNDVVQGVPVETYRERLDRILDALADGVPTGRILLVTTPDYTVTPAGADYGDPTERAAGIRAVNAVMTEVARARALALVDIHDISLQAATDRSLVASDGLHPSGLQYGLWVERIVSVVERLVGRV
jgi:lysophospholipase L1-like esterase